MKPQKLALESFTEGDGWDGIPTLSIKVNGTTPAAPIEEAKMVFQKATSVTPNPVIELTDGNTKLVIGDAAGWEISVPAQVVPGLTEGKWLFQIKIKPVDGLVKTYISDTVEILKTVG